MGICLGKRIRSSSSPHHPTSTSVSVEANGNKPPSTTTCCGRSCRERFRNSDSSLSCSCNCSCFKWGKRSSNGLIDVPSSSRARAHRHGSTSIYPDGRSSGSSHADSYGTVDPNLLVAVTPQVVNDLVLQTLVLLRTLVGK